MVQSTATLLVCLAMLFFCFVRADNNNRQCNIMPSWKQLSGTFTMRGQVMSNGQPKSGVYVTLQTKDRFPQGLSPYSVSEPVLTDQNGNYVLQRTFTDYHRCYGDQEYSLHFGKTECDAYPNQVFNIADLVQEFRSDGNILQVNPHSDVTVNANMNCH